MDVYCSQFWKLEEQHQYASMVKFWGEPFLPVTDC